MTTPTKTDSEQVYCYVGKRACGCYVAAAVDQPKYAKDNAKTLAEWIRDGLTVERQTLEFTRTCISSCKHKSG